ncbi:Hypothetical_protein [Hexamita inflata]|uniref:Hypothetical_protein n=1 Tax=Hexamita inflata TaxID=28002 RepID=A0AA86UZE4_9EUKA|nr:Hypothetical protein HINF_LOCUS65955 [Hexamita inflata]
MQRNCWFGHTTSSTPHLIPNCEVKSGQATSSTALGDYAGTGCAERFLFLAAPAFLPVAREEFQGAPAVSRSGEPSAGVVGQNRKNEEQYGRGRKRVGMSWFGAASRCPNTELARPLWRNRRRPTRISSVHS